MFCINNCCNLQIKPYEESIYFKKMSRRKAGVFIYDPELKKVLIVLSRNRFWGLPKGSVKIGESDRVCAVREVKEETGIDIDESSFTYAVKVNNSSIYFYMELQSCNVNIQESKYQEANDVNGIGWITLDCLDKSLKSGHIQMNSHGKYVFEYLKKYKFT
jgi:ADP-ribose pyrophosphatase YjhB (NUDIX family)